LTTNADFFVQPSFTSSFGDCVMVTSSPPL
jgi:hypothetical protein